jgi:predicted esterase
MTGAHGVAGCSALMTIVLLVHAHGLLPGAEAGDGVPPVCDLGTAPAAGVRFREIDPVYQRAGNLHVTHCVYLPSDWRPGRTYPVLVEYAGNRFKGPGLDGALALDGTCASARMGFFLSGAPGSAASGVGCIWVAMPFIRCARDAPDDPAQHREATRWYGVDGAEASDDALGQRLTAGYLARNLPDLCRRYGGDPRRVVLCGFSRGAIAGGFIGRSDDAVAALFRGFILHSHHDASGQPLSPADPGGRRCRRAVGRPSFLSAGDQDSGRASTEGGAAALRAAMAEVEVRIIPGIPHTDEWLLDRHYGTPAFAAARDAARAFLWRLVGDGGR